MEISWDSLHILAEIQKMMTESKCELELFKGRIIFMSTYNDIVWGELGNKENCMMNSATAADYARKFLPGRSSFLGPGSEKKWSGTHHNKPDGDWDRTAEDMMLNFVERGHPTQLHYT